MDIFTNSINSVLSEVFSLDVKQYNNEQIIKAIDDKKIINQEILTSVYVLSIEYNITSSNTFLVGFSEHAIEHIKTQVHKNLTNIYDSFDRDNIFFNIIGILVCNMETKLEDPVRNFKYELPKQISKKSFISLLGGIDKVVVGHNKGLPIIYAGLI